jgi:hypothetical protein
VWVAGRPDQRMAVVPWPDASVSPPLPRSGTRESSHQLTPIPASENDLGAGVIPGIKPKMST